MTAIVFFRKIIKAYSLTIYEKVFIWLMAVVYFGYGIISITHYLDKDYYRAHLGNVLLIPGLLFIIFSISLLCSLRIALISLFFITVIITIFSFTIYITYRQEADWPLISIGMIGLIYSFMLANIFYRHHRNANRV